jgi:protein-disulfide isomerase
MSKQFWIALTAIVVILGAIVFVTNHNKGTNNTPTSTGQPTNHVEGSTTSGVTLVEYGDYECPVCADFYVTTKQVAAQYKDKIIFQFRNLPLTSLHQNAFAAARAAEAAALQNKFWEMHDTLYENQTAWASANSPQSYFNSYATQLGLDLNRFKQDYASAKVNDTINADLAAFKKTGDDMATPTYYLDGKKLNNADLFDATGKPSVSAFSKLIDAEIAKKTAVK